MSWSDAAIGDVLIATRGIHFAATAITAGALIFRAVVAEPALCAAPEAAPVLASHVRIVAWTGFVLAVATGLAWLQLETMSITGLPFWQALTADGLGTIVEETQFGQVAAVRQIVAVVLAIGLLGDGILPMRWLALAAALAFAAAIAWTGHAGSTAGNLGTLHLASDILHLWAASAWIGGLILLALLLEAGRRAAWRRLELAAVRRFSTLGIFSVATLVLSGIINAWIILPGWQALLATTYGRILLLKLAVFAAMLAFAAVNRLWLTPELSWPCKPERDVSRELMRNTTIELALGLVIFAIVGALGLQHPAMHP